MTASQAAAVAELREKSIQMIQAETAVTWAHRAWAARELARSEMAAGHTADAWRLSHDSVEYEHEAVEHAALCEDDTVLAAVRAIIAGP